MNQNVLACGEGSPRHYRYSCRYNVIDRRGRREPNNYFGGFESPALLIFLGRL